MGPPDKVEELGETEIPEDVLTDYLFDLSPQFTPETYNLLEHNCNNFSDELAQLLTGNSIPSYITNLPAEILETPFGAQIKPFLEAMQGPSGGTSLQSSQQSKPK